LGKQKRPVLKYADFAHYIQAFNEQDEELYRQAVPNARVDTFLAANIPLLDIPDKALEKVYYFRWWTYRKHLKSTPDGYVITEFLPDVPWAGKYNTISCPAGHQLYEGRWLRDPAYLRDYAHFWLTEAGDGIRSYSFWAADAFLAFSKVYPDQSFMSEHLPLLENNYAAWVAERQDSTRQLFWQIDNRDGMEFSASGRMLNGGDRIGGMAAIRPTINSYQYGDAKAIAQMADYLAQEDLSEKYQKRADRLKRLVQERLWNDSLSFFTVLPRDYSPDSEPLDIRELIGYVPWYFNLPDDSPAYAAAWKYVMDSTAFLAPYGLTVCEQTHPYFEISYEGHECQWNGPSWPFATTQVLKGLANLLSRYEHHGTITKTDYYALLKQYADSHQRTTGDGRTIPWIDENLNPFTGDWISRTRLKNWNGKGWVDQKGGQERGKDYNHSGFCDLVISDLIGLKPQLSDTLQIKPLVPEDWAYFCLDKVNYHGKSLPSLWDQDGSRYGKGKGFRVYCDGELVKAAEVVRDLVIELE
jgi:hypothetical protein